MVNLLCDLKKIAQVKRLNLQPQVNSWVIKLKLWAERHQTAQWSRGELQCRMITLCGCLTMNDLICFLFLSSSQSSDSSKKQKVEITTAATETAGNGERHTGGLQWKCGIHSYHIHLKFRQICHVLKKLRKDKPDSTESSGPPESYHLNPVGQWHCRMVFVTCLCYIR